MMLQMIENAAFFSVDHELLNAATRQVDAGFRADIVNQDSRRTKKAKGSGRTGMCEAWELEESL
jgi:hypothetical protein